MKRTRLISIALVILMLMNVFMPVMNVVAANDANNANADGSTVALNDGTGTKATTFATYNDYTFNNKLYKALKADFKNRNIDARYDDVSRKISINSEAEDQLTVLNLNYAGINDLTNLNVFKNVKELYLSHNDLSENSNLEVINSFNLTKLDISSNRIANVSAIADKINALKETDGIVMGNQICEVVQQVQINNGFQSDSVTTVKFDLPQILTMASNVKPHWERIEFVGEDMHGQVDTDDDSIYWEYRTEVDNDRYYVLEGDAINNADDTVHITINDMPIYVNAENNQIKLNVGAYYRNGNGNYSYILKRGMLHFRIKIVDDQTEAAQANNTNHASTNLLHDSVFDLYFIVHDDKTDAIILKDSNLYQAIKDQLRRNQLENPNLASYKYSVDAEGNVVYDNYTIEKLNGTNYYKLYLDGAGTPVYYYNPTMNKLFPYDATKTTDSEIETLVQIYKEVIPDTIGVTDNNGIVTYKRVYKISHEGDNAGRWLYRAAYDDAKAFIISQTDLINEITNLKLNNKQIRDLTGIEGFIGLALELNLSHNYLEAISPLLRIMETKAATVASLQEEYNRELGYLRTAYNKVISAQSRIETIGRQMESDENTFKAAIASAYQVPKSTNQDEAKRIEEDEKSLQNIKKNIRDTVSNIQDRYNDKWDDNHEKITSYGLYSQLYGYHLDANNNEYVGAYEELESAINEIYSHLDVLYNAIYKDEYRMTTLLADGLNYQDVLEYENYLKQTEGFEDDEATYSSALSILDQEISYISQLESSKQLSDFDKMMIQRVFDFTYRNDTETPISNYLQSDAFRNRYLTPSNRFNVVNTINKFRKIAIYSEMANYCLIKRISSNDVAEDNCFAKEYLEVRIHEKDVNQTNPEYERAILEIIKTDDPSHAQDNVDEILYNCYKEYRATMLNLNTYTVNKSTTPATVTGYTSSGNNAGANEYSLRVPKGGTLNFDRIRIVNGANGTYDVIYNEGTKLGEYDATLGVTPIYDSWQVSGNASTATKMENGVLTVASDETATNLVVTCSSSTGSAYPINVTYNITVGDYAPVSGQTVKNGCSGDYKRLDNLGINILQSTLTSGDVLSTVSQTRSAEKTYFDQQVTTLFNYYIDEINAGIEIKDVVLLNDQSSIKTKGINETLGYFSGITSKKNQAVYNQLMSIVSSLINGNVSKYVTIPKLADLDISYNAELTDISAVTQLNTLTRLNAEYDYISDVDQVDWSQLPLLRDLNLGFNFITDISPITNNLKHLRSLNLRRNLISEIPIVPDGYKKLFRNLKKLDLSENLLTDLYPLVVYLEHITNGDYANYIATNNDGVDIRLGGQRITLDAGNVYLSENPITFDYELPRIFTQLQAVDVNRTAFGVSSRDGRIESEGTYVTLPTRTTGEKEGVVTVIAMSGDGTPVDTCVGIDTTATIRYNVLEERQAVITLNPSGNVVVPKGGTKKFSVSIEEVDASEASVTWTLQGNTSENTKVVDGELTVGADETAETFTLKARVMVGDVVKDLEATIFTKEGGGTPDPNPNPNPLPDNPTEPVAAMTPSNPVSMEKGSSKTFTMSCAGFNEEGISDISIEWTLSGFAKEGTKVVAVPREKGIENGRFEEEAVVSVDPEETAQELTIVAVVKYKKNNTEYNITKANTISVIAQGSGGGQEDPTPDPTPDTGITAVVVNPHGTVEMNKGETKNFTVSVEGTAEEKAVDVKVEPAKNGVLNRVNSNTFSVTIPQDETAEKYTITITSVQDPTKKDVITINIKGNGGGGTVNPDQPDQPDQPEQPDQPSGNSFTPGYPVKDTTNLANVLPKTPIDAFKSKVVNNSTDYKAVVKKDGTEVTTGYVSTGCTVEIQDKNGNTVKDSNNKPIVYEVIVKGDINGDGLADSLDSLLIKAHRAETQMLQGVQFDAADIDGNGKVDVEDARLLLYHRAEVNGYVFNYGSTNTQG